MCKMKAMCKIWPRARRPRARQRQIPPSGGRVRVVDAAGGYPEHPPTPITPITPITPQRVATNPRKPHESVSGHTWLRRRSALREREDAGGERVSFCRPFEFNWDRPGERGTGTGWGLASPTFGVVNLGNPQLQNPSSTFTRWMSTGIFGAAPGAAFPTPNRDR